MKEDEKQKSQPAQKTATTANVKAWPNKQQENQKRISLVLAFLLVFIVFAAIAVPVSYIPFLNNIANKFGLPTAITRQLTLLDLALSSLGVETAAMKAAFAQREIVEEPADSIFYSRFEAGGSRLINAREAYYHEFERTRRRPDEISGIYKDGKTVDAPDLAQGQVGGVRSLPEEDYLSDDISGTNQGSAFKDGSNTGSSFGVKSAGESYTVDTAAGGAQADARKARQSIDKEEDKDTKSSMPGFVSSVYANNGASKGGNQGQTSTQTVDINNSRMIKPVLKGSTFGVSRKETPLETFVGNSDFSKNLSNLRSFGGHDVLGFYIADDPPKNTGRGTFQKFGTSGEDAINSYFYSHVAVGRKYRTSAKYLAELAFSGEKANNEEILVARGQKEDRAPSAAEGMSPVTMMKSAEQKIKDCNNARKEYEESSKELRQEFNQFKSDLKSLSRQTHKGAPGACRKDLIHWILFNGSLQIDGIDWGNDVAQQRMNWNSYVDTLKEKCEKLDQKAVLYAQGCNMEFSRDSSKDTCASLLALKLNPPTKTEGAAPCAPLLRPCHCESDIRWADLSQSYTFNGCNTRESCSAAIDNLFKAISENENLTPNSDFAF